MYKIEKETLLTESQNLGFDEVQIDAIFESIEDKDMKEQLKEAFILASRNGAVKLAEAHIEKMTDVANAKLDEAIEEMQAEFDHSLVEAVEDYILAVGAEWLAENKLAVGNTVKADLFESMLESLKTTLIEHNVSIPEEQIDIYEELALEEKETREMANKLFKENQSLVEELNTIKRDSLIGSLSVGMTESQRDSFSDLAKAIKLDESYESRIEKLSETIRKQVSSSTDKVNLTESLIAGSKVETKPEVDEEKLVESVKGETKTSTKKQLSDVDRLRLMV